MGDIVSCCLVSEDEDPPEDLLDLILEFHLEIEDSQRKEQREREKDGRKVILEFNKDTSHYKSENYSDRDYDETEKSEPIKFKNYKEKVAKLLAA